MKSLYCFLGGVSISIFTGLFARIMIHQHDMVQVPLAIPSYTGSPPTGLDMVELNCMASNIFFESRGEDAQGKAMVGLVVMERVKSPHFPHSICGVVKQANVDINGKNIINKCSFSWYCDGEDDHPIDFYNPAVEKEWQESLMMAQLVMLGMIKERIDMDGVTHYHNKYVHPYWAKDKNYKLIGRVGDHLFYRWKKAMLPRWQPNDQLAMN